MNESPPTKHCNHCGHRRPIDQFRRVYADRNLPRHSECNECRNRREREKTAQRRQKRTKESMTALAREGRKQDVRRVHAVVTAMLEEFGGVNAVVQEMVDCLEHAPPGSPAKARILCALVGVVTTLEKAERIEADRLDQQARRGVERENARYAWARDWTVQELAEDKAHWLRRYGWKVTAPESHGENHGVT